MGMGFVIFNYSYHFMPRCKSRTLQPLLNCCLWHAVWNWVIRLACLLICHCCASSFTSSCSWISLVYFVLSIVHKWVVYVAFIILYLLGGGTLHFPPSHYSFIWMFINYVLGYAIISWLTYFRFLFAINVLWLFLDNGLQNHALWFLGFRFIFLSTWS